jgi:hypothetical protein
MSNARTERLTREALGGYADTPFPERVIRNIGLAALAILVAVAVTPSKEKSQVASSAIDARAAATVNDAPPARLSIDPQATEGNVVDMTY